MQISNGQLELFPDMEMDVVQHLVHTQGVPEFVLNINTERLTNRKLAGLIKDTQEAFEKARQYIREEVGPLY